MDLLHVFFGNSCDLIFVISSRGCCPILDFVGLRGHSTNKGKTHPNKVCAARKSFRVLETKVLSSKTGRSQFPGFAAADVALAGAKSKPVHMVTRGPP